MAVVPRLKLCLLGLGRLGALRARILAFEQPRIELVAVCDTKPGADAWAAANLPPSVKFFATPEDCLKNSGAQAVLISTATATHAPLICLALDLDLVCTSLLSAFAALVLFFNTNNECSTSCAKSPFQWTSLPQRRLWQNLPPSLTSNSCSHSRDDVSHVR